MALSALIRPSRSTVWTAGAVASALASVAAGVWLSTSSVLPSRQAQPVPPVERGAEAIAASSRLPVMTPSVTDMEPPPQPGSIFAGASNAPVTVPSGGSGTEQPPAQSPSTLPPGGDRSDHEPDQNIVGDIVEAIDAATGIPVAGTAEPLVDTVDPVADSVSELLAPQGLVPLTP